MFTRADLDSRKEFLLYKSMHDKNSTLERKVGQLNRKLGIMELLSQDKLVCNLHVVSSIPFIILFFIAIF